MACLGLPNPDFGPKWGGYHFVWENQLKTPKPGKSPNYRKITKIAHTAGSGGVIFRGPQPNIGAKRRGGVQDRIGASSISPTFRPSFSKTHRFMHLLRRGTPGVPKIGVWEAQTAKNDPKWGSGRVQNGGLGGSKMGVWEGQNGGLGGPKWRFSGYF